MNDLISPRRKACTLNLCCHLRFNILHKIYLHIRLNMNLGWGRGCRTQPSRFLSSTLVGVSLPLPLIFPLSLLFPRHHTTISISWPGTLTLFRLVHFGLPDTKCKQVTTRRKQWREKILKSFSLTKKSTNVTAP